VVLVLELDEAGFEVPFEFLESHLFGEVAGLEVDLLAGHVSDDLLGAVGLLHHGTLDVHSAFGAYLVYEVLNVFAFIHLGDLAQFGQGVLGLCLLQHHCLEQPILLEQGVDLSEQRVEGLLFDEFVVTLDDVLVDLLLQGGRADLRLAPAPWGLEHDGNHGGLVHTDLELHRHDLRQLLTLGLHHCLGVGLDDVLLLLETPVVLVNECDFVFGPGFGVHEFRLVALAFGAHGGFLRGLLPAHFNGFLEHFGLGDVRNLGVVVARNLLALVQTGHLEFEVVVVGVDHDGIESFLLPAGDLGFELESEKQFAAEHAGVLGLALAFVALDHQTRERLHTHLVFVQELARGLHAVLDAALQHPVHQQVRLPPNRGSLVGVVAHVQREVVPVLLKRLVVRDELLCRLKRAQHQQLKQNHVRRQLAL